MQMDKPKQQPLIRKTLNLIINLGFFCKSERLESREIIDFRSVYLGTYCLHLF